MEEGENDEIQAAAARENIYHVEPGSMAWRTDPSTRPISNERDIYQLVRRFDAIRASKFPAMPSRVDAFKHNAKQSYNFFMHYTQLQAWLDSHRLKIRELPLGGHARDGGGVNVSRPAFDHTSFWIGRREVARQLEEGAPITIHAVQTTEQVGCMASLHYERCHPRFHGADVSYLPMEAELAAAS